MKTQNNKLRFNKNTMIELNNKELLNIEGGTQGITIVASMDVGAILNYYL